MIKQLSQQPSVAVTTSGNSDACTLPQFLSAYGDQASSYAAAVRRSPNRSTSSPWSDSRTSSPTAGLSTKLAPLHLGSKGSSPSSTTSESASERDRERPLSAGAVYDHRRHKYFSSAFGVRGGESSRHVSAFSRTGFTQTKPGKTSQQPGRPRSNSCGVTSHNRPPKLIPGILTVTENPSAHKEEAKASDGGWIKVERQKRLPRPDNKQVRGRPRRGGRGGRGGGGGARIQGLHMN